MLSQVQIGSRLRAAREQCDISQEEAADALALRPADVTSLESGQRAVSTLEIMKLAEIYHYPATFFLSADKEWSEDDPLVVLHQELSKLKSMPDVWDALWRLFDLYGETAVLRRMLDQTIEPSLPDYRALIAGRFDNPSQEGEFAAEEERCRLGLGNEPIRDVVALISRQGIWTASVDLPDDLYGLFANQHFGLAVLVNRKHSPAQERFSYLHQFAHALFDRFGRAATTTRRQSSPDGHREIRADAFAAAFLMPPEGVAEQLGKIDKDDSIPCRQMVFDSSSSVQTEANTDPRPEFQAVTYEDVAVLAHHFGVGYETAVFRLHSLDHIDSSEKKRLAQKSELGREHIKLLNRSELSPESASPETSERELCSQLKDLAIEAFRQEEISRGRLAEIGKKLKIDRDDLLELAQASHFS